MKKVYIAGKISGMEKQAEILFQQAEQKLIKKGYQVVNPMTLPHDHDKSWESYMKECLTEMMKCDLIYPLPNWDQSRGAKIEMNLARELDIRIIM